MRMGREGAMQRSWWRAVRLELQRRWRRRSWGVQETVGDVTWDGNLAVGLRVAVLEGLVGRIGDAGAAQRLCFIGWQGASGDRWEQPNEQRETGGGGCWVL